MVLLDGLAAKEMKMSREETWEINDIPAPLKGAEDDHSPRDVVVGWGRSEPRLGASNIWRPGSVRRGSRAAALAWLSAERGRHRFGGDWHYWVRIG